jgi:hypothetical protein
MIRSTLPSPTPDPTKCNVILDINSPVAHPPVAVEVVVRVATVAATTTTDMVVEATVAVTMMMVATVTTTSDVSRGPDLHDVGSIFR